MDFPNITWLPGERSLPIGLLVNGSSLFLQVPRTAMKSWRVLKLRKIVPGTAELAALERLEK